MTHTFHPTVLREYDIRGIIGKTLGEADAYAIGRGFATLLRRAPAAAGWRSAMMGGSARRCWKRRWCAGSTIAGLDAVRVGMGPTPMLYYAEASAEDVQGGIQITGSHNPANYNGFKMVFLGRPFFGADIQRAGRAWPRPATGSRAAGP